MFNHRILKPKGFTVFYNENNSTYEGYCKYCQDFHSFTVQQLGILKPSEMPCCYGDYNGFNPHILTGAILNPMKAMYKPEPRHIPLSKVDNLKRRRDKAIKTFETPDKYMFFTPYPEATPIKYLKDWERLLRQEDIFQWDFVFGNIAEYSMFERFFMKLHDITKAGKKEAYLKSMSVPELFYEESKMYGR